MSRPGRRGRSRALGDIVRVDLLLHPHPAAAGGRSGCAAPARVPAESQTPSRPWRKQSIPLSACACEMAHSYRLPGVGRAGASRCPWAVVPAWVRCDPEKECDARPFRADRPPTPSTSHGSPRTRTGPYRAAAFRPPPR